MKTEIPSMRTLERRISNYFGRSADLKDYKVMKNVSGKKVFALVNKLGGESYIFGFPKILDDSLDDNNYFEKERDGVDDSIEERDRFISFGIWVSPLVYDTRTRVAGFKFRILNEGKVLEALTVKDGESEV